MSDDRPEPRRSALEAFEAFDRERRKATSNAEAEAARRRLAELERRFGEILEVSALLASTLDLDALLSRIVDAVIRVTGCERGMVMLADDDGSFSIQLARNREHRELAEEDLVASRTIVERVARERKPFIESNLDDVDGLEEAGSIHEQAIRSAICLPLVWSDELVGVIYADSGYVVPDVLQSDHRLLEGFAAQAAIAIVNAREHGELLSRRERLERQNRSLRRHLSREVEFSGMVSKNPRMLEVFETVEKVAQHDINVLIQGESGTGKELLARAIHDRSPRADGPFETVNCAGIPSGLVESILFGHRRGAFTGATQDKPGLFELADGGTLFLDEIGDMPLEIQPKILRAVQEGEVRRVGEEERVRHVDVRIIAATHIDLTKAVRERRFREDLYFRLNVARIHLPPLRERRDDIVPLAQHFMRQWAEAHGEPEPRLSREARELLVTHDWKGNIRELKSAIEWGIVFQDADHVIHADPIERFFEQHGSQRRAAPVADASGTLRERIAAFEAELIRAALREQNYNVTATAKALGISRQQLHAKLRRYGIPTR